MIQDKTIVILIILGYEYVELSGSGKTDYASAVEFALYTRQLLFPEIYHGQIPKDLKILNNIMSMIHWAALLR